MADASVLWWAGLDTPVGPLTLVCSDTGLVGVSFVAGRATAERLARSLADRRAAQVALEHSPARLAEHLRQFGEYFAGTRREFDLPLDWSLTEGFARRVLHTLYTTVGYGRVLSYQDLAARAGRPRAARVVGAAVGANPLPVVVPCHRVVAADGLGGYGPGLPVKRWLLALEGVLPATLDFA